MSDELLPMFERALSVFLRRENDVLSRDIAERNLCSSFATYLEVEARRAGLRGYRGDSEYNRNGVHNKEVMGRDGQPIYISCDVILHSRGHIKERDNLIAIEMKKATNKDDREGDLDRLRLLTTKCAEGDTSPRYVCGYELGIFLEFDIKRRTHFFQLFRNGAEDGEVVERAWPPRRTR